MNAVDAVAMLSGLSESELFRWAVRSQHLARVHGDVAAGAMEALREIADSQARKGGDA